MRVVLLILYLGGRGGTQTVEIYLHAWKKYIGMTSSMEQHGSGMYINMCVHEC